MGERPTPSHGLLIMMMYFWSGRSVREPQNILWLYRDRMQGISRGTVALHYFVCDSQKDRENEHFGENQVIERRECLHWKYVPIAT